MVSVFRRPVLGLIAGLVIVSLPAPLLADPGFGTVRKKKIDLKMRRPALVRLANTTVAFKGNATDPQYRAALNSLAATLETELVSNEKTLIKQPEGSAEWTVALTITGFQVPPPTTRTTTYGNSSTTFQRWTGTMNVAYQVVDRSGRVHDADNVSVMYDKEINANAAAASGSGLRIPGVGGGAKPNTDPRTQEDVKQLLIQQVVVQIGSNLGNTVQLVDAQVAGGESALDRAGDFMVQQLWARAVEELEKKSAFVKPEDESYRQYNLGLAYEAMSYNAKTFNEQRANLFKAQEFYDKAIELNPKQRYFVAVVARTKDSIARYRTLEAMSKEDRTKQTEASASARSVETPAAAPGPATSAAVAARETLSVDQVIQMHQAKVDPADIIRLINGSEMSFPLDSEHLIKIKLANLPAAVENAMRARAGHPARPGTATAGRAGGTNRAPAPTGTGGSGGGTKPAPAAPAPAPKK